MEAQTHNPWLLGRKIDLLCFFIPVWLVWVALFLLPAEALEMELPLWVWVAFVLGIDVSHVWSTIFRTYTDPEEFRHHKKLLLFGPPLLFVALTGIALLGSFWFWRILAYLALYHFIKQQYGFFMLYKARMRDHADPKLISDKLAIYLSMLYPVLYWHFSSGRHFSWFIEGDFFPFGSWLALSGLWSEWLVVLSQVAYWGLLLAWLVEEVYRSRPAGRPLAIGKMAWLLSTAANWYLGIVWFNSDLAFTLTNVVAHGLPYFALVFFYVERKKQLQGQQTTGYWVARSVLVMFVTVVLLALGEEYLWDYLLNGERMAFFGQLWDYSPALLAGTGWQAVALALLSLPQVTHYLVDGFIWKSSEKNPYLKPVLLPGPGPNQTKQAHG